MLPILPPATLPSRKHVPLEKHSSYLLAITGLAPGDYEIRCESKAIGTTTATALEKGINLNSLVLDSGRPAPWEDLAKDLWAAKGEDRVGKTRLRFEVVRR